VDPELERAELRKLVRRERALRAQASWLLACAVLGIVAVVARIAVPTVAAGHHLAAAGLAVLALIAACLYLVRRTGQQLVALHTQIRRRL
jgi:hypothetical protein